MRFIFAVLMVLPLFFSCSDKNNSKIDVSKVNIDFSIKRYDVDFYNSTKETLPKVKDKYPYLFPVSFSDSLALAKIKDKQEQELFHETQKLYKDFSKINTQLSSLFKHIKYYNPKFIAPDVVTMLTNIDYDSRVIYADTLLLVSLDMYLGKNHQFYADFPKYIKENNTRQNIVVDVANSIIEKQLVSNKNRSFISKMIFEGKKLYLLDKYLPLVSNKNKIGFQQEKLDWAIANQEQVWVYFVERKLLYSTDSKLNKRFLESAPFSKFYLAEDAKSPGRIGAWIGWQIVRSYMQYNDVSLQELINIEPQDLFKKSKYKPKK
jgi:gliding motility-associated lipoprotein GldB